jgi:hypothetical protein
MSGKGSRPRPFSVSQEEYEKRWDMIFGRDLQNQDHDQNQDTNLVSQEIIDDKDKEHK